MGYYEAKFLREQKDNPIEWFIIPVGYMRYNLIHVGPPREYMAPIATVGRETNVPYLRVVK